MENVSIPIVAILAWAAFMMFQAHTRSKQREFAHRERLAMIERGLVPPPDKDPATFERLMRWQSDPDRRDRDRRAEARSAGIMMLCIGVGLGLMLFLVIDDDDGVRVAMGIGGLVAFIGVGLLLNSVLGGSPPPRPAPPSGPNEPR